MTELTGKEFNEKYTMEFYEQPITEARFINRDGYISFAKKDDIKFVDSYGYPCFYIRKITILDDSAVLIDSNEYGETFRTDKAILHEPENMWENEDLCKLAIAKKPYCIRNVKNQTPELCKLAVNYDGNALTFINEKTPELCELAVKHNGMALAHVTNQTYELCELALKNNGIALIHVKNQTPELCEIAVYQNGLALGHVKKDFKTSELCELAISQNEDAAQYVPPELVIQYINKIKKLQALITKLTPADLIRKPKEMLTINKVASGRDTDKYLIVRYDDVFDCVNPKSQFFLEKSEFISDIATFDMLEEIFHQHEFTNNNTKQSKYDFTYNISFTDKMCTLALEIPRLLPLSPIKEAHKFTCQ